MRNKTTGLGAFIGLISLFSPLVIVWYWAVVGMSFKVFAASISTTVFGLLVSAYIYGKGVQKPKQR